MVIRELFTKLGLDVDAAGFAEGVLAADAVKGALKAMGQALTDVAKAMVGAITDTAKTAGEIDDLAKRTGVSSTALQELKYASEQSGSSFEAMAAGLKFLSKNSADAMGGNEELRGAFAKLGVSVTDSAGKLRKPEAMLGELADAFNALGSDGERTQLAMKVLGKSGTDLIPFFKEGSKGIEAFRKEAHELNIIMGEDLISAGDNVGDNVGKLDALWTGLKQTLAGPVLQALEPIIVSFIDWAKANREVIATKVKEWGADLGEILTTVAGVMRRMPVYWDNLKKVLKVVGAALLGLSIPLIAGALVALGGVIGSITMLHVAWGAAALLGGIQAAIGVMMPILGWALLGIAIIAAFDDLMTFFNGGDSLIGRFLSGPWKKFKYSMSEAWTSIKDTASEMWTGIVNMGKTAFDSLVAWFKSIPEKIASFIPGGKVALDYYMKSGGGFAGGAASPGAAAAGAAGAAPGAVNPRMSANFVMNVAPGTDAPAVAGEVEKRMDAWWSTKIAENYVALEGG